MNASRFILFIATVFSVSLLLFGEYATAATSLPQTVRATPITDPTELQRIRAEFQYELGHDGYVVDCHHAIDYVEEMPSGHDSSYGAICTVAKGGVKRDLMMCNDWMIGKFTKTDNFEPTLDAVTKFIYDHCPPGG